MHYVMNGYRKREMGPWPFFLLINNEGTHLKYQIRLMFDLYPVYLIPATPLSNMTHTAFLTRVTKIGYSRTNGRGALAN